MRGCGWPGAGSDPDSADTSEVLCTVLDSERRSSVSRCSLGSCGTTGATDKPRGAQGLAAMVAAGLERGAGAADCLRWLRRLVVPGARAR